MGARQPERVAPAFQAVEQGRRARERLGTPHCARLPHAFRMALPTNIMDASSEPGAKGWPAAEWLIGPALPGEVDIYRGDRRLMPLMRLLAETIPAWEKAARARWGKIGTMNPRVAETVDLGALR